MRTCLVHDLGSRIVGGFLAAMMCFKVYSHRNRQVHSNDNPANMLAKVDLDVKLAGRAHPSVTPSVKMIVLAVTRLPFLLKRRKMAVGHQTDPPVERVPGLLLVS